MDGRQIRRMTTIKPQIRLECAADVVAVVVVVVGVAIAIPRTAETTTTTTTMQRMRARRGIGCARTNRSVSLLCLCCCCWLEFPLVLRRCQIHHSSFAVELVSPVAVAMMMSMSHSSHSDDDDVDDGCVGATVMAVVAPSDTRPQRGGVGIGERDNVMAPSRFEVERQAYRDVWLLWHY